MSTGRSFACQWGIKGIPGIAGCLCSSGQKLTTPQWVGASAGTRTQKGKTAACPLQLSNSFHEGPVEGGSEFPAGLQVLAGLGCGLTEVSVDRMCDLKLAWSAPEA